MVLSYKGTNYQVQSTLENGTIKTNINDNIESIILKRIGSNIFESIKENKKIFVAKDSKHIYAMIDGFQYILDLKPDDFIYHEGDKLSDDTHDFIYAPMPGSIVQILVNEGDVVAQGTPVIIIEAMKMETKLYSSISGRINKVNCSRGMQVDTDLVLIEIINLSDNQELK
ncbi:hypothetical protein MASR1M45_11210 [Candidatus Kapaibacterium sp.]